MDQFADEIEILAITVRELIQFCDLARRETAIFFLAVGYGDTLVPDDAPPKLLRMLKDAPVKLRPFSMAKDPTPGSTTPAYPRSYVDCETGELGFRIDALVGKLRPGQSVPVKAAVNWGPLASHGFSATAFFEDEKWTLYYIRPSFS